MGARPRPRAAPVTIDTFVLNFLIAPPSFDDLTVAFDRTPNPTRSPEMIDAGREVRQDAQLRAISSEREAFSDIHFRVTGDSSLRPAHDRLRGRRQIVGKGRFDIR